MTNTNQNTLRRRLATALAAIACLSSLLVAARPARAAQPQIERAPLPTLRHDVRLNFGYASAVGFAGMTYTFSPAPVLELEGGVGYGYSGVQLSLMPKLSVGSEHHRFIAGVGLSASLDPERAETLHTGAWLNAEIGYTYRGAGRLSLLIAGGVTAGLGGKMHALCIMDCDPSRTGPGIDVAGKVAPQFRVASGWWF